MQIVAVVVWTKSSENSTGLIFNFHKTHILSESKWKKSYFELVQKLTPVFGHIFCNNVESLILKN